MLRGTVGRSSLCKGIMDSEYHFFVVRFGFSINSSR